MQNCLYRFIIYLHHKMKYWSTIFSEKTDRTRQWVELLRDFHWWWSALRSRLFVDRYFLTYLRKLRLHCYAEIWKTISISKTYYSHILWFGIQMDSFIYSIAINFDNNIEFITVSINEKFFLHSSVSTRILIKKLVILCMSHTKAYPSKLPYRLYCA